MVVLYMQGLPGENAAHCISAVSETIDFDRGALASGQCVSGCCLHQSYGDKSKIIMVSTFT